MRKLSLTLLASLLSFIGFGQITFVDGYFINNSDEKTICTIRNVDWSGNPDKFEYKLPNSEVTQIATIKDVKEFAITEESKYKRFTVLMDRSSSDLNKLESSRTPTFNEEQHFLKVLVEGNATLYKYTDGLLNRYFLETNTQAIEQLVFKPFITKEGKMGFNNYFRQQLWNYLKCDNITMSLIDKVEYKEKPLVNFFLKFNMCMDPSFKAQQPTKEKKDLFSLSIRPGLDFSSLVVQNYSLFRNREIDFGMKSFLRLGLEAEFILPFNKNRWAVMVEPTFQYYQSESEIILGFDHYPVVADYKNIDLPIGIRYYAHLSDKSKLFLNAAFAFGIAFDSSVKSAFDDLEITSNNKAIAGGGYCFKNRYSLEIRYNHYLNLFGSSAWTSDFSGYSFIAGYRF